MSLLANAAKISEQGSQVISQGKAAIAQGSKAISQGKAAVGQGLEKLKNINMDDIKEFGSKASDLKEKGRSVVSNLNPMNLISEFDRELKAVFRRVKSKACKIANTKAFSKIIEDSVLANVKKIAEGKTQDKEGYGFFENLYMTLFLALISYDNPASRLFMVEEYRFLLLDIKNLNNQLLGNSSGNVILKEEDQEEIPREIHRQEDILKSLIQNTLTKSEIFVSTLLKHSGFLTAMCQNEIFLKQIVEKKIFSTYGNEFTVQFVKQSKRKISKKELTQNEVNAFLKALNEFSLNKGIHILAEKKETNEEGQTGGGLEGLANMAKGTVEKMDASSLTDLAKGAVGNDMGSLTDTAAKGAVGKMDASSLTDTAAKGAVGKMDASSLTDTATGVDLPPEAAGEGAVAPAALDAAPTASSLPNMDMKPPAGMDMSKLTGMLSKFGPGAAAPPADKTGYPYMDKLKIKNQVGNTFVRIREKICDILGREAFHEKLKEMVFLEIEPTIQKHMNPTTNQTQVEQSQIGNPENENFYNMYQKLFKYLKINDKTKEDVYQELEKYCKSILQKIKSMESEKSPILRKKNAVELGHLKECLNLFIEHMVMDNVFMTYLFENPEFCSVVFHDEFFFDYIVHNLDENGFMGSLVEYWTTYRESDLENGNEIDKGKNKVNKTMNEEEKEDQQAIEEEEEEKDDASIDEEEKKRKREEIIEKEKRKKYREFLLELNRKLAPSDTMFGLFNGGGEQDAVAQMGGACSDNIIKILQLDEKNVPKLKERIQNVIKSSDIVDSYGRFLYKSFERIKMQDIMEIYKETLPPKGAVEIFQETELFKENNTYTEGDNNQDGIVSQLSGKGKEHLLVEFIVGIPDNKGYEKLIRYILTAEKLKHNRFFLFRKLFEMMGETDMIEFVSEYTAICEKVGDVKLTSLGEGLGKVEAVGKYVGNTIGDGVNRVGDEANNRVVKPVRKFGQDTGNKIKEDFVNSKTFNRLENIGEYVEKIDKNMRGRFDKLNTKFKTNVEDVVNKKIDDINEYKKNIVPNKFINKVNTFLGNTDDKLIDNASDSLIKKNLPLNEDKIKKQFNPEIGQKIIDKYNEKKALESTQTKGGGFLGLGFGKKKPETPTDTNQDADKTPEPPKTPEKSPKEVVEQISGIISSGNVVTFLDPGLLSNLLRMDTINLLIDPQTIIHFLKLVNKDLLVKMTDEIPDTIQKMIAKIKELVDGLSIDSEKGSATFTEKATTTPDATSDVKKGGADGPETTTPETIKAPDSETKDTDTDPDSETIKAPDSETKPDKKITITKEQIDKVVLAVPEIIKEKAKTLERNIIRLGVSNIPLMIKLYYLKDELIAFNDKLVSSIQNVNIGELLDIFKSIDFSKILGISDDKLKDLIKNATENGAKGDLFSGNDLSDLKNQLPGLLGGLGLDPAVVGNLTNKLKNQDAAQEADAAAAEKENEPEPECSDKLKELLEKIKSPNQGRPIDEGILIKIIESSINKKNIEYLFEKEVIQKMSFPSPEIKNVTKRMIALILGIGNIKSKTAEETKKSQIDYKENILDNVFTKLSNYNLRKVIVMVFENLSKNPVSVSDEKSEYSNTISLYLECMRQFYTGYILKTKDNTDRSPKEVAEKLGKLMQHMQKYSEKSGLGVLKDRSKPLDKLRYVCRNKQNTTRKRVPDNSTRLKSYKKIDVNNLRRPLQYIPGYKYIPGVESLDKASAYLYKNLGNTIYDINNASEPIRYYSDTKSPVAIKPMDVPTVSTDATAEDKAVDNTADTREPLVTEVKEDEKKEVKSETDIEKEKAEEKAKKEKNDKDLKEYYERIDNKPYYPPTD